MQNYSHQQHDKKLKVVLSHVDWNVLDPQRQVHISFNSEADAENWLANHDTPYKQFWKVEPAKVHTLEAKGC